MQKHVFGPQELFVLQELCNSKYMDMHEPYKEGLYHIYSTVYPLISNHIAMG